MIAQPDWEITGERQIPILGEDGITDKSRSDTVMLN